MSDVAAIAVVFVAMEAVTYATHRWVMHGIGWVLHRSHHRRLKARFEANDAFPVMFSGVAMAVFALAGRWEPLWPVFGGITAYGVAYLAVHDLYIHRRLGTPPSVPVLDRLAAAHALHHRFGGEPYGMLLPVVPSSVRQRSAERPAPAP